MKPNNRARYAAAITLSKGKMHEFGVPEEYHLELPGDIDLEDQFPFAIGTLGDFAAQTVVEWIKKPLNRKTTREEVIFAAQIFQAYDESGLNLSLRDELKLLSAAAFYLADVPGSSLAQIRRINEVNKFDSDPLARALQIALNNPWGEYPAADFGKATLLMSGLKNHFLTGAADGMFDAIVDLRKWAYGFAGDHELFLADILAAVVIRKLESSAWSLLPTYSNLQVSTWKKCLARKSFIKEMWPSQRVLGEAEIYKGASGIVQMPTSAGKTRATELILRAAFLSARTKLAIVIAPFRALCQEIASDLRQAFLNDPYRVNKISDALRLDYETAFPVFLDDDVVEACHVVVLTPEKLLYILRREPILLVQVGLIIYDEGHQFDVGVRGVVYELLLTSIKSLLPTEAQTVLISAVIENADDVARWLLEERAQVVKNDWLQTRRLVGFASLPFGKEGQLQFNVDGDREQKFYVPRVIVKEVLKRRPREKKDRIFPDNSSGSIALYLGLILAPKGAVAIYVRTKASAAKLVRNAVENVFERDVSLGFPVEYSDLDQVQKFGKLFEMHFGENSYLTKAVKLGIFSHHASVPHGVRLSIEYAMRTNQIKLIVCTSTLAQGVNLPIKYLLVTSPMQGADRIRPRDFHNLMGRAGRAGMHGEGIVIFTDPDLYDQKDLRRSRWKSTLNLLKPAQATSIGSSLLGLALSLVSDNGEEFLEDINPLGLIVDLIEDSDAVYERVVNIDYKRKYAAFSKASLIKQLDAKKEAIEAVESFIMTFMGEQELDSLVDVSRELARRTLAFSLANDDERDVLENIFVIIAARIENLVPDMATKIRYGQTLLGLNMVRLIDDWVLQKRFELSYVESVDELLDVVRPLLIDISKDRRIKRIMPDDAILLMMDGWLAGLSFEKILDNLKEVNARVPYGRSGQNFTIDIVVDMCEQTFGFEFAHLLPTIASAFRASGVMEETAFKFDGYVEMLQMRFKCGLPTLVSIAFFEVGFSDRVVAQLLAAEKMASNVDSAAKAVIALRRNFERVSEVLDEFPQYFRSTLGEIVDRPLSWS